LLSESPEVFCSSIPKLTLILLLPTFSLCVLVPKDWFDFAKLPKDW
jgi:hypothetical protein